MREKLQKIQQQNKIYVVQATRPVQPLKSSNTYHSVDMWIHSQREAQFRKASIFQDDPIEQRYALPLTSCAST